MEADSVDLLDSTLRSENAEGYAPAFINNNIDISTLPSLTDADLQVIGVDNSKVRKALLQKFAVFKTAGDTKSDLTITDEYCERILNQIFAQLSMNQAALVSIINRKNLLVLNIPLHPASQCFTEAIRSLKQELDSYEKKFKPVKKRTKATKAKQVLVITGACAITMLVVGQLIRIVLK